MEAFVAAKPLAASQCGGFIDSMFLNKNRRFLNAFAFRRRTTAVGLRLLYHKSISHTTLSVEQNAVNSRFVCRNGAKAFKPESDFGIRISRCVFVKMLANPSGFAVLCASPHHKILLSQNSAT